MSLSKVTFLFLFLISHQLIDQLLTLSLSMITMQISSLLLSVFIAARNTSPIRNSHSVCLNILLFLHVLQGSVLTFSSSVHTKHASAIILSHSATRHLIAVALQLLMSALLDYIAKLLYSIQKFINDK